MSFDGPHADRAVAAMQREVEALTKASGFHLQWRSLENRGSEDTFSDLMAVTFHGSCNMQGIQLLFSELGPETDGGALGSTKTSDGEVLPFSELYCDRIRRSIAPLSMGSSSEERESLLGRAMGRSHSRAFPRFCQDGQTRARRRSEDRLQPPRRGGRRLRFRRQRRQADGTDRYPIKIFDRSYQKYLMVSLGQSLYHPRFNPLCRPWSSAPRPEPSILSVFLLARKHHTFLKGCSLPPSRYRLRVHQGSSYWLWPGCCV